MNIYVRKDGNVLGPFSRADVENHLQHGAFAATDPARLEGSIDWRPLSAVRLGGVEAPPHLHWAIVLTLSLCTLGFFTMLWIAIQLNWIRKLDNDITALVLYIIAIVSQSLPSIAVAFLGMEFEEPSNYIIFGLVLLMVLLQFYAIIRARDTMQVYFNETEPIGLKLDLLRTLVLNTVYLQYHLSRIAHWKKTGILPD